MHLDWWTIALQTANFAVLVWLLRRFLYAPVLRMIDARKAEIERQYERARAAEDEAKARLAVIETEQAGIAGEREAALKSTAAQAQEMADARRARAEREAQALLDAARQTIAAERDQALREARRVALDLGAEFAQRLLAEVPMQLRAEAWLERIEQYFAALPTPEREALAHQLGEAAPLVVVTAVALPGATTETWRGRLRRVLGDAIAIAFEIDPALIAGAELHFPTAILRFSWRTALATLRSEITHDADAH